MKRVKNLENSIYHKKYKEIYKIIFTADLDTVSDHSNWFRKEKNFLTRIRPLWIICESVILNKRIWITEEFGILKIATAQLDLDVKTKEYHNSFEDKLFKNQKEMSTYLKQLLMPCLEEREQYAKCS